MEDDVHTVYSIDFDTSLLMSMCCHWLAGYLAIFMLCEETEADESDSKLHCQNK